MIKRGFCCWRPPVLCRRNGTLFTSVA